MNKIMCFETATAAMPLCLEQIHVGFVGQQLALGLWGKGSLESFLFSAEGTAINLSLEGWLQPLYEIVLPNAFSIQDIRVEFGSCSFEQHSFMESWSVLEAWDGDKAVLLQAAWHGDAFVSLDTGILHHGTVEPVHTVTKDKAREALALLL
jgi:hypothetical protein